MVGEIHLGLDKDREKRLANTARGFESGIKTKTWSSIVLPIILIIILLFTVFIALN